MKNLNEKCLLVNLSISQWTARKFDRKVTDEVNQNHNTSDAGRFNKLLIAKEHLEDISKLVGKVRDFHYKNTLIWSDAGERILTSKNYFEYVGQLSVFKNEFDSKVAEFVREYPAMIAEAQRRLNGLYNPADYPDDIESKFQMKTTFMPVPDSEDFRINLHDDEVKAIREQIQGEVTTRFAKASVDVYERITDQLKHMHERLSDPEAIFKNSLFENLKELTELLPRLNVTDDPNIDALCAELRALYVDPDAVRQSKHIRSQKTDEVQAVMSKLDSFFQP